MFRQSATTGAMHSVCFYIGRLLVGLVDVRERDFPRERQSGFAYSRRLLPPFHRLRLSLVLRWRAHHLEEALLYRAFYWARVFKWTQRTFRWAKEISEREEDVTAVIEDARWYRKTLKLMVNGKVYALDDLLEDDLTLLARQLRMRLGTANSSGNR